VAVVIYINVTHWGAVPGVAKRRLPKMLKAAFLVAGRHWHRRMRPEHFTRGAFQRYAGIYRARGKAYAKKKAAALKKRGKPYNLPLVYTGESRRATATNKTITGTSKGVTIRMRAPGLNWRGKGEKVNKRRELTFISDREGRTLVRIIDGVMEKKLMTIKVRTSRRIA
jgi:hypothetical protein